MPFSFRRYRYGRNKKDLKVENNGRDLETKEVSLGTDKYKLPYGLCAKYGIALPPNATPTDAWNALKGHGIKPSDVYKELQKEGDTDNIKPSDKKVVESKEKTKEELKKELSQKVVEDKTKEVGEKEVLKKSAKMLTAAEKAQLVKDFAHEQYPNTTFATMYDAKSDKSLGYTFNTAYGYNDEFTAFVDGKLGGKQAENFTKEEKGTPNTLDKQDRNNPFTDDAYSQERKNKALNSSSPIDFDNMAREKTYNVWKTYSYEQKYSIVDYTGEYSKYNEPLRGIEYGTSKYLGVGKVDMENIGVSYKGYKKGQINAQITAMTQAIEKSSYDKDVILRRGCNYSGMDKFFSGVSLSQLEYGTTEELTKLLVGNTYTDNGFTSCGSAKGKGFTGKKIQFSIYAPKGTKMLYVDPVSHYGQGYGTSWQGQKATSFNQEVETIIQRGTSYRITEVKRLAGGKLYVRAEVVGQTKY